MDRSFKTQALPWMLVGLLLSGCATNAGPTLSLQDRLAAVLPADALLLGEQHDAPDHHRLQTEVVSLLASRRQLAALILEMADQGSHTRKLPTSASETQVKAALNWSETAWPWPSYSGAVMAAVRSGVPVLGANLPRSQMREKMNDSRLDALLPQQALMVQRERVRTGHCDSLPPERIGPMVRIQIARDLSMAQTIQSALRPQMTVVLLAGRGHVDRLVGIPLHLPASLSLKAISLGEPSAQENGSEITPHWDAVWPAAAGPSIDYCAQFKLSPAR